jgi:YbbR domain-containing protein
MIRDFFYRQFSFKLFFFSLAIAVMLWFYVIFQALAESSLTIPIQYDRLPPNISVLKEPEKVTLVIEGPVRLVKKLQKKDITASLDLAEATTGVKSFHSSELDVKMPRLFRVTGVEPEYLKFTFDKKLKKNVDVTPMLKGTLKMGLRIEKVETKPDVIIIEGPASLLEGINQINTIPIDIGGLKENHQDHVSLQLDDKRIKANETQALVTIYVRSSNQP